MSAPWTQGSTPTNPSTPHHVSLAAASSASVDTRCRRATKGRGQRSTMSKHPRSAARHLPNEGHHTSQGLLAQPFDGFRSLPRLDVKPIPERGCHDQVWRSELRSCAAQRCLAHPQQVRPSLYFVFRALRRFSLGVLAMSLQGFISILLDCYLSRHERGFRPVFNSDSCFTPAEARDTSSRKKDPILRR